MQHSRDEGVTQIVVDVGKNRNYEGNVWKKFLTNIEEEEFDSGEEMRVKFTTLDHLSETVTTGTLPLDLWGDTIERGARASVFYKDLMFVIPNNNDDTIDNDFITSNGGLVLNDQLIESMRKEDEDIQSSLSRIIYIVTDETVQQAITYCNNNCPLLVEFANSNKWSLANSIWAKAQVDTGEMCDPEDHPLLFQPQEWPSVKGPCLDKMIISVSGFNSCIEHQAIILWIEKLGATYAESLSTENTHLIAQNQNSDYNTALGMGTVHKVSINWLYDVIQHGYKGYEERYPVPIKITFKNEDGGEFWLCAVEYASISELLQAYVNEGRAGSCTLQFRFLFGGNQIVNYDATLTELGLNDGDTIDVEVNKDVIKVMMQDATTENGIDLFVNMRTIRLSEIFQSYAARRGIELSSFEFYFKDEMIKNLTHTPMTLGLCDGSTIKVVDVGRLPVTVRIRDMDSRNDSIFTVKRRTRVEEIFQSYADREDVYLSNLVFYLDGEKIDDYNATPITLNLEDDDQIDVIVDCRSSSPSIDCEMVSA